MRTQERTGLLLGMAGFACFTVGDAVAKSMTGEWSPIGVAGLRFLLAALILSALLVRQEGTAALRPARPGLQMARGLFLGLSTLFFFSAFFVMPLAVATSIAFAAPAITAVLSGPLLGEKVRPATWVAVVLAFAGVLIVLRPNVADLGLAALLPLGAAVTMSLLMIANRASAGQGSSLSMQAYVALGATPVLAAAMVLGDLSGVEMLRLTMPDWTIIARCAVIAVTGSMGHWLVYLGTTRAGASTIAPAAYVQLLTATGIGWLAFGDAPDLITFAGAGVIIGAGMLLWWDGRVLATTRGR